MDKEKKRLYDIEYRKKNREKIAERRHKYYLLNKDRIKEYKKQWQKDNRDRLIKKARAYRRKNRLKNIFYQREHYRKNKERYKEYNKRYNRLFLKPEYTKKDMQPRVDFSSPSPSPEEWDKAARESQNKILMMRTR